MKITETCSHLGGLEFLLVRKPRIWDEICVAIGAVNASNLRIEVLQDQNQERGMVYTSTALEARCEELLRNTGWRKYRTGNQPRRATSAGSFMNTPVAGPVGQEELEFAVDQKQIYSDFTKDRVALGVEFVDPTFCPCGWAARHLGLYVDDQIDVGIGIFPMKSLQIQIISSTICFEAEHYNVIRQGRGVPAVPLVMIGIEP